MLANKLIKPNRSYQRKGHMRFATKKYSNPFFSERKKIKNQDISFELPLKTKIIFFSFVIFFITLLGVSLYSNVFKISEIEASGEGRVGSDDIKAISEKVISQKYIKFLPGRNIILMSKTKLKDELESQYAFDELIIKKDYPNKIVVNYKEKSYAFVLKEDDNYFYLDIDGYVIDEANILELNKQLYPVIKNDTNFKIKDKKTTIDKDLIDFVMEVFLNFKQDKQELFVDHFIIDQETKTVKADLEDGPVILFNSSRGVQEQIEKLLIVKEEKIKNDFKKKEYIDLRYGDSVYYR